MISYPFKNTYFLLFFLLFFNFISCGQDLILKKNSIQKIETGAQQTNQYLKLIASKNIAIIANQTSVIFKSEKRKKNSGKIIDEMNYTHLVDSLLSLNINITKVFSPEHGFRGNADAGEKVTDGKDDKTGLSIISLYGSNKKPTEAQLKNIDVVVFDIQDVGVRFYTYISTLHYVMEACAGQEIPLILLDRPNPNSYYIDGPTLEIEHTSFVGMHPIPVVYGMTIGEYAQMINGENWLKDSLKCDLKIITLKNYTHQSPYHLPIKPSPNLPNDKSINLYPSLCFFEGTNVSAGRGTEKQFQIYGSPFMKSTALNYCFTPKPTNGAKHPKHENTICCGFDLSETKNLHKINLSYLVEAYSSTLDKSDFFNPFFTKLAGTKKLQQQIENNTSIEEIYDSWQPKIKEFKKIREKYLLYE